MQPPILERNCMEGLQWRWEIPPDLPLPLLKEGLQQEGYHDKSPFEWVWSLEHENENKVVIVPRTRRLQIRLSYLIEKEKRPVAAWSIALLIHEICTAADQ